MNKVILLGNITKEIVLRNTPSGAVLTNFNVATNDPVKDKNGNWENKPTFHSVIAFGKNAENIAKFFGKGSKILIEGSIRKREWVDKNQVKRIETEVLLEKFEFVEKKKENDYSQGENNSDYSQEDNNDDYSQDGNSSEEIKIEDIPF